MLGGMTWYQALTWAGGLVYGGFDDWRLPTAMNPDGSGPCPANSFNCTGSEMGHLYYTKLGNQGQASPLTKSTPPMPIKNTPPAI